MRSSHVSRGSVAQFRLHSHDVARLLRTTFDRRVKSLGLTRSQWWVLQSSVPQRRCHAIRARRDTGSGESHARAACWIVSSRRAGCDARRTPMTVAPSASSDRRSRTRHQRRCEPRRRRCGVTLLPASRLNSRSVSSTRLLTIKANLSRSDNGVPLNGSRHRRKR